MTDTSNAPSCALSPHVLDLQRGLLREVIRRFDTFHVTGEVLPDTGWGAGPPDESGSAEPAADPMEAPTSSLQAAFANRRFHRPIAEDLTPGDCAALIARGDDPWAAGIDASGPIETVPVRDLLAACGLVRAFGDEAALDALLEPGAITLIPVRSSDQRAELYKALKDIVPPFMDLAGRSEQPKLAILRMDDLDTSGRRDMQIVSQREIDRRREDFDTAVARNTPILILASGAKTLPDIARRLPMRILPWPGMATDDIVEVLRATHSHTGCLAEEAIRMALPPADRAAALAPILWRRAMTEVSPIRAAQRLSDFCADVPAPAGLTLADLHGQPLVRAELEGLVTDVEAWRAERLDWSDVTSSFLLTGPPGTGKTMAATALAGSANVHCVSTSYGACQAAGHLGDYLKAMKACVDEAIERAPSIFFLDEINSYPRRDGDDRHGSRYNANVVNALLTDLTRLANVPGVIVIGATNHPERVDPAIVRSGRFDRHLRLDLPDRAGVATILKGQLGPDCVAFDVRGTVDQLLGCTGADIAALVRLARGFARRNSRQVNAIDLDQAVDQIAPRPTGTSDWETAVHEAGHIAVSAVLDLAPPRSARLTVQGGEVSVDLPDRLTRDALDRRMAAVMGGRAAEELILGNIGHASGIGSQSDLGVATNIGLKIETEYGLGEGLIYAPIPADDRTRLPEGLRRRIERHLSTAMRRASDIVAGQEVAVRQIADALLCERELDAGRIADLTQNLRGIGETGGPIRQLQLVH